MFSVTRCNKQIRSDCKSDAEIDEYIRDIQVDTWVMQQMMNYDDHEHEKPVSTTSSL